MRVNDVDRLHLGYTSVAEITIEAPPSTVWRHVVDVPSWIFDYHFEPRSAAAEGAVWTIWPEGAESAAMLLKTLALVPEQLWSGINPPRPAPDGSTRSGQTLIFLTDLGDATRVAGIRGHEAVCPSEEVREAIRAQWEPAKEAAQIRWTTKYLPRIKQLAEADAGG